MLIYENEESLSTNKNDELHIYQCQSLEDVLRKYIILYSQSSKRDFKFFNLYIIPCYLLYKEHVDFFVTIRKMTQKTLCNPKKITRLKRKYFLIQFQLY